MIGKKPDLETRIETAIVTVLKRAFPKVDRIGRWSDPQTDDDRAIVVRVETSGEELPGTGIELLQCAIQGKNLFPDERHKLKEIFGSSGRARTTLSAFQSRSFIMPAGEAVLVEAGTRAAQGTVDRIVNYHFTLSAQPYELTKILAA